jgi:hypothetical protein
MMVAVIPPKFSRAARLAGAFLLLACGAHAALWVSTGGDDRNPGTEEQPLRTIGRARDLVRTMNHDMTDDITVFIGGEHHVGQPIVFGPEDSGTNGFNIVYVAAPGERPVVSGGFRVSGWTLADGTTNLWAAPAPPGLENARDLYVNGTPAAHTRGRLLQVFSRDAAGASVSAPDPGAQWKNPGDVSFTPAQPGSLWSERTGATPVLVENAFELLGRPGEWYFDRPAGRIYYTPRVGEDMAKADAVAAAAGALVSGYGSADRPITGIIFKGIRFEYAARPDATRADSPAAVSFAFAGEVQFLEDDFLHMGTVALRLGPGVDGATIDGCVFADISRSALSVSGSKRVRLVDSRISYVAWLHPEEAAVSVDHSDAVAVENNQIDHFPSSAVSTDGLPGSVGEASDLVAAPMIGFHGADSPAPPAAAGAGVPAAYRSILDERFSSPTPPRPPERVSAEAEDSLAYVTWTPSCLDGGSPVTSYTVTLASGTGQVVSAADFQALGYIAFGGLDNGHGVSFTVTATNAVGTGPPSLPTASVKPLIKRRLRTPGPPAIVSLTTAKSGTTVHITPSGDDGGSPVIAYILTPSPAGETLTLQGLDVVHSDVAHPLSREVAGYTLAGASTVAVAAVNVEGTGKPTVVKLQH